MDCSQHILSYFEFIDIEKFLEKATCCGILPSCSEILILCLLSDQSSEDASDSYRRFKGEYNVADGEIS